MARSTRHSRDRKPGVTIDGTASETGKKSTTGGAVNADAATGPDKGDTSAGATSASATTTSGSKTAATGEGKSTGSSPATGTAATDAKAMGGSASSKTSGDGSDAKSTGAKASDTKASDTKTPSTKEQGVQASGTKAPDTKSSASGGSAASSAASSPKAPPGGSSTTGGGARSGGGGARSGGSGTGSAGNDNRGTSPILAGVIGGVAALLLAWLLSALGMFGADQSDEIAALRSEIETLRASETLSADDVRAIVVESAEPVDPAVVQEQVATIVDQRIAEAGADSSGQGPIDAAVITSLDERLARLEAAEGELADVGGVTPEIEARLAQIEAGLGAGDGSAQAALDALQAEIAALREGQGAINPAVEQRIAQVEAGLGADPEARAALQALEARLEELAGQQGTQGQTVAQVLAQLEESGVVAGDTFSRVETLTSDFGTLTAGVEGVRGEVVTLAQTVDEQVAQLGTLRDQIETVRGMVEGVDANVGATVQELRTEIQTVRGTASNANGAIQSVRGTLQDLSGRTGRIDQTLQTATTRLDDVAGRLDDLSGRVEGIDQTVQANATQITDLAATVEEARTDRTVARAMAANTLKNTIDRGLPFAPELEAYAAVAENPDGLTPLREFAGRGVPTVPQLLDRFDAMAARVMRVDMNVGEDAGVGEQLGASMRSLFTVREVDVLAGDGTQAVLARMENALQANDLRRVLDEAGFLGVAEQEVAEPFLNDVRARIAADSLIDDALASALRQAG